METLTNSEQTDPLLDTIQSAEVLDYTPQHLRRMRCVGNGPPFMKLQGGHVRYRFTDLQAYAHLRGRQWRYTPQENKKL